MRVETEGEGEERRRRTGAIRLLPPVPLPPSLPAAGASLSARRQGPRAGRCTRTYRVTEELDVPGDDGMDAGGEKCGGDAAGEAGSDLYAVLGLKKECSDAELKVAYRKLAMVRNWILGSAFLSSAAAAAAACRPWFRTRCVLSMLVL